MAQKTLFAFTERFERCPLNREEESLLTPINNTPEVPLYCLTRRHCQPRVGIKPRPCSLSANHLATAAHARCGYSDRALSPKIIEHFIVGQSASGSSNGRCSDQDLCRRADVLEVPFPTSQLLTQDREAHAALRRDPPAARCQQNTDISENYSLRVQAWKHWFVAPSIGKKYGEQRQSPCWMWIDSTGA